MVENTGLNDGLAAAVSAETSVGKNLPLPDLLLGTYTPKMDAKGRVAIPAKLRKQLGSGCVMARGQERCVYLLPNDEFRRIAQQIQHVSLSNKAARNYLRVFLSGAVDLEPDKQGRIMVPPMLRTYANLSDDVVLIGVGTRAELWNRENWDTYLAAQEDDYSDMAEDILPGGDFAW
ncbi:division/cell wall cluster transcriptional repressor MraZ [Alloscardovia criceti]|uniref:division/cell wall cluster transcriptional repressor MraZ n=1 Tax=Alloscardovia criceti TaxID=356828 RepID=UPI000364974A|nr:division/cell wall cluster transcriptional repressor MraZ [Alloscardovia criceti]